MVSKYHNRRISENGYMFDSIAELAEYQNLCLLEKAGEITCLAIHPRYEIIPAYTHPATKRQERAIFYEADFSFNEMDPEDEHGRRTVNHIVVLDVKGFETATWRLKRRLFLAHYPNLELRIVQNGQQK